MSAAKKPRAAAAGGAGAGPRAARPAAPPPVVLPALPLHPALYQINTRVWMTALSGLLGRPATLDDVPDEQLDVLAAQGFDWVYLLGVWRTGAAGPAVSRSHAEWREEFECLLSDLTVEDICGSCFALTGYTVSPALGGDAALARLRARLAARGLRLMLDFVPNHTALDHPWVGVRPDHYVHGTEADLAREPHNYTLLETPAGPVVLAFGRDPYFSGWPDTLQLDYGNPALQEAMTAELAAVASAATVSAATWPCSSCPRSSPAPGA